MSLEDIAYNEVIFDPSLLIPPTNTLLDDILNDGDFVISLTEKMRKMLFPEPSPPQADYMPSLLKAWGAKPEDALSIVP
jgi:hypothetical protein